MKKQTITAAATYLFGGTFFLALLFLFSPAMHQALGQGAPPSTGAATRTHAAPAKPAPNVPVVGQSQVPTSTSGGAGVHPIAILPMPNAPQVVLYDQYNNNAGTSATLSATFTDFPTSSADLADDFVVPAGQTWNVQSIDADGTYFNGAGPATNWNVYIYTDSSTLPGTQIFSATNQPVTQVGTTFTVNLPVPAVLTAGTYWIEIQANMTFGTQGEWGWTDRTVQSNSGAAFRNPGGAFGCGTVFVRKPVCVPTTGGPDQVFRLNGTTGSVACDNYTTTTGAGTIVAGTTDTGNHCDDCATPVTFPFPVGVYGQTFNSANVSSNGSLDLIGTQAPFTHGCQVLPNTLWTMAILPYQDDLRTDANTGCAGFPGGVCGVFTSTTGTAPNRQFNIEWRAVHFADTTAPANFSVVFYENDSSFFDVFYGATSDSGLDETSGVQASSSGSATTFSCGTAALTSGLKVTYTCAGAPSPCNWVVRDPVPYNARGIFSVSDGTYVYAGGGFDGTTGHTDLRRFDPVANSWTSLASSPDGHYLSQAVIDNGKIYNMGGFDAAGVSPTNITRIYNIGTNTWTTGAPMPATLADQATALWAGTVYVAGGYNGSGASSALYAYNIATNSWTTLASMPAALYLPGFGAVNGKLYVASGNTGGGEVNTLYIYDIATNSWTTGAAVPTPTTAPGSAVFNGKLYLYGGGAPYPTTVNVTQIYDPISNTWSAGPNMNVSRLWFYGTAVGSGSIVAPGGDTTPGIQTNDNEQLTGCGPGSCATWTVGTPYPTTIVRYGFAETATHAYVFGGVSDGTRVNTVNRMDFGTGAWQPRAAMPFTSEAPTCALMASTGIVYCTEGDTGSGFASYNIATDTWTPLASIPGGDHYGSASGAFNGKVFVAGGTTAQVNTVQVYDVASNTWSPGTAAPNDFLLAGYQQVGQNLYVVGGFSIAGPVNVAAELSSVLYKGQQPAVPLANNATTLRLDMSSAPGVWSTGPAFTPGRADFGLAYDAGTSKLYALAGDANGGGFFDSTNLVDELSVGSWPAGAWAASPPNLILPNRSANQAGFYGAGQIWSVGGLDGSTFTFFAEVQHRSNGSCGPVPSSAVSRKVQGAFTGDINLPLVAIGGAVGIECRNGAGVYQMVITFPGPVTVGGVSVTSGTGSVGSASVSGAVVTVNLTGVADAQRLGVTLTSVNDGTSTGNVLVPMGVLIGDSAGTGNGTVNAGDVGFVKSKSGQTTDATNFRADIAINGTINAGDVGLVKSKSGNSLPP